MCLGSCVGYLGAACKMRGRPLMEARRLQAMAMCRISSTAMPRMTRPELEGSGVLLSIDHAAYKYGGIVLISSWMAACRPFLKPSIIALGCWNSHKTLKRSHAVSYGCGDHWGRQSQLMARKPGILGARAGRSSRCKRCLADSGGATPAGSPPPCEKLGPSTAPGAASVFGGGTARCARSAAEGTSAIITTPGCWGDRGQTPFESARRTASGLAIAMRSEPVDSAAILIRIYHRRLRPRQHVRYRALWKKLSAGISEIDSAISYLRSLYNFDFEAIHYKMRSSNRRWNDQELITISGIKPSSGQSDKGHRIRSLSELRRFEQSLRNCCSGRAPQKRRLGSGQDSQHTAAITAPSCNLSCKSG